MSTLLAFDTATQRMSVALAARGSVWVHESDGGAQASAALIPAILALLTQAGVGLRDLDAIAFGRGPGAFTGLRTACSVVPIDTLLAVAEDARDGEGPQSVWVANDARMSEVYAAHYVCESGRWSTRVAPFLCTPHQLNERWDETAPDTVAGSALAVFGAQLRTGSARLVPEAMPRAQAMLLLARALWDAGGAVDAALAMPLYVREKVAQTTAEREAARAAKDAAALETLR